MSVTVAQIIDKVSEAKSRMAILEGLALYLRTNYTGSDHGPPEMTFTRLDYALVPQEHINDFVVSIEALISESRDEIAGWERLLVIDEKQENERPKQKKKKVTREQAATARRHSHHSASRNSGSEGDGQLA